MKTQLSGMGWLSRTRGSRKLPCPRHHEGLSEKMVVYEPRDGFSPDTRSGGALNLGLSQFLDLWQINAWCSSYTVYGIFVSSPNGPRYSRIACIWMTRKRNSVERANRLVVAQGWGRLGGLGSDSYRSRVSSAVMKMCSNGLWRWLHIPVNFLSIVNSILKRGELCNMWIMSQ